MDKIYPKIFSVLILGFGALLSGCYTLHRLEHLGNAPPSTPIKDPTKLANYHPVVMPMPEPDAPPRRINSLWQTGARGFFKDQRAKRKGDILTVDIDMSNHSAEIKSETDRSRSTSESAQLNNALGYEQYLPKILPHAGMASNLLGMSSNPNYEGSGMTKREEKMRLKIAATIIQTLPNGNYVIQGRQEMRVNFEMREMSVTGIVRPSDIDSTNTVRYEKIAEGRIVYGGRGNVMDFQQPAYGQQLIDHIMPF